ncbi:uncharacterized protein EV154DRAFT_484445 [Mucor mucedo]|uniref:uncharacterized protein n=1 Tax=Mucor mucedo TaxID=29922 RepID=UPI00221F3F37|nr:uncharacterized protein EV154DRAFT_484445 [Mucor mucedo]KAI7888133.1 hypothetical protein EV154DRAFT_484445 [Mucor mucedo]
MTNSIQRPDFVGRILNNVMWNGPNWPIFQAIHRQQLIRRGHWEFTLLRLQCILYILLDSGFQTRVAGMTEEVFNDVISGTTRNCKQPFDRSLSINDFQVIIPIDFT